MKIVKAYAVTQPTLMQSVNEGPMDWLKGIANRNGAAPAPAAKPAAPDVAGATETSKQEDPLGHVVGSILKPLTHGQTRVVIYLDRAELTNLYLKDDDTSHKTLAAALLGKKTEGLELIKAIALTEADPATGEPNDPDSVQAAQADLAAAEKAAPKPAPKPAAPKKPSVPKASTIVAMKPGYKFSDLFKSAGAKDYAVLLDVNQQLYDAYKANPNPDTLSAMFNHKYYVTTLSASRAKKIAPQLDAAVGDIDAERNAFNPDVIVNYPAAQTIKLAKAEWNEKHADEHARLTAPAKPAAPAEQPKVGGDQGGGTEHNAPELPAQKPEAPPEQQAAPAASSTSDDDKIVVSKKKLSAAEELYAQLLKKRLDPETKKLIAKLGAELKGAQGKPTM